MTTYNRNFDHTYNLQTLGRNIECNSSKKIGNQEESLKIDGTKFSTNHRKKLVPQGYLKSFNYSNYDKIE